MKSSELRQTAISQHSAKKYDLAKKSYAQYLAIAPNDHVIWSNLGALFRSTQQFDYAVIAHERALRGEHSAQILGNASNAYFDAGDAKQAVKLRKQLLKLEPDDPMNHAMLGKFYRGAGKYKDAQKALQSAVKKFPDHAELRIQLAMTLLSLGEYPDGFREFEWRWQGDEISLPDFDFPIWRGQDLTGKTIVVTPEQGFGDTILMARFFAGLKALGCQVKFLCKKPLVRLLSQTTGIDAFVSKKSEIAGADYWVPMMDLPRYLDTTFDTIPAPATLHTPEDSIARANAIVAPFANQFKLGVLWSGSVTYRANHKRSFDHHKFLELSDIENLQMFSLYKGPLHDDFIKDGANAFIVDAAGHDRDFADSAALIKQLDLVVTMDSAIAHVAGSLGVPVWNLLHSEAYWLYEPHPKETPWYPTMRLIRQKSAGDWDGVFNSLYKDIKQLVKKQS
ncbi:hypothetical protein BFP76_04445 [Amylibacter kogurei]|uniref:Uncharacterized protein n=1 Tax=Paramylibacter kogurei TaxID=1889778 RepID=A0A2G5K6F7_9RHOB|nr:tetratricopeptide repeat protein [Amylibacter kogurei]PIB24460.1 hypothetical protein BFP76_04445 [Amylibacter kogurei]